MKRRLPSAFAFLPALFCAAHPGWARGTTLPWQAPVEKQMTAGHLAGHLHGARSAENVEVAWMRNGKKIFKTVLSRIEAPLDLKPRVVTVYITATDDPDVPGYEGLLPGDIIVVDPDNAIPEIAEHNNRLVVKEWGLVRSSE